jgi:hypothetical protein
MNEQELAEWDPTKMLEISLEEPDDFLKIKETLTRIGICSKKEYNTLFQSCHILHKQGRYFIVHFKELFLLVRLGIIKHRKSRTSKRQNNITTHKNYIA